MSQDYGIDNEGTGFAVDDDEDDMESMFNRASDAAEAGEDSDNSHLAYLSEDYIDAGKTSQTVSEDTYSGQTYSETEFDTEETVNNEEPKDEESKVWEIVEQSSSINEEIQYDVPTYDETVNVDQLNDNNYEAHEEFSIEDDSDYVEENAVVTVEPEFIVEEEPVNVIEPTYEESTVPEVEAPRESNRVYTNSAVEENYVENVSEEPKRYGTYSSGNGNLQSENAYSVTSPASTVQDTRPVQDTYQESVNEPIATQSRRFNITTEAEDITNAQKIIRILDVYRSIPDSQKNTVAQLIYNENEVDHKDEAKLVVKVLHADPILSEMMTALRESAMEKDRVERVFYVLKLNKNLLDYLGEFLNTIVGVEFSNKNDQIGYSKEMEAAINDLDPKIVQFVADAQSVLAAAKEE